jgi:hypothetical protein
MAGNIRNSRTTQPRRRARQARALARFEILPNREQDQKYLERKLIEKTALVKAVG